MKKTLIFTLLLSFLFLGCSTKRQYFEPSDENITGDLKFNGSLPSEIVAVSKDGATLKNGQVISKNGLAANVKLLKSEKFLGEYDGNFVITDVNGTTKVADSAGSIKFEKNLGRQALSASIRGDDLALVMSDDSIMLIKLSSGAVVLDHRVGDAFAIDSRVAPPLFINQLIAYPALDGLVSVVEHVGARSARDFVVSNQPFFNNIIALENSGDNLYAATATRLMLVGPAGNKNHNRDIKDAIFKDGKIYLFLKDGTVELAADAGADELPLLQNGAQAQVSVRGRNEAVGGTVRLVPPEIDSSPRLGKVRITLAHSDGLYTGTYGEANIRLPSYRAAAALPETAVSFDSEGKASVLAVDGNGRVSRVPVTAGRKQGGMVEIVSGLENGRAVVRRASAFVNEGDTVKAVEEKGK